MWACCAIEFRHHAAMREHHRLRGQPTLVCRWRFRKADPAFQAERPAGTSRGFLKPVVGPQKEPEASKFTHRDKA